MAQRSGKAKPRIFTFTRSGWILRVIASDVCLSVVGAAVIWFRLVMPRLPTQAWIRYSLTIAGLIAFYVLFEFILGALVSGPICRWMTRYDEPVSVDSSGKGEFRLPSAPI